MQITVEDLSKIKKKISFEIPASRVDAEIDKVYDQIRKHAAIKGFRKGKAPQSYIEKNFRDRMEEDVLKNLVNDTYFKALMDNKIYPVSQPVIESDELKKGESLTYSATVEVFPEVSVEHYFGLELNREKYVFSEDIVDARLQEMREGSAQMQPVEGRAAEMGDSVTLDFVGYLDGVPFDNGSAEDFVLELGSGRFIPGFEEQVVGMQVGEQKEIKTTFPENYTSADLAGKDATFAVTVKQIKRKELPPLDDDFAKIFGEFETLDELKAKLAEYHEIREKERIDGDLRDNLIKVLVERNPFEVPAVLVDRQVDGMLENTKKRLAQQRASLEMMGLNEELYRARFREIAEVQVKGSLLMEAVAAKEGVAVGEADMDAKFSQIAEQSGQNVEAVKAYFQQNKQARENLAAQVKEEKVAELLLERANISEVSGKGSE